MQRLRVRTGAEAEPGRVSVLDLRRARTRRFQVAFVLGLEEGSLPGGGAERRVLDAAAAAELGVEAPDPSERERHLFTIACTRPWRTLYLSRQAATDDGRPLEPSPFWAEVVRVLGPQSASLVRRRGLADVSWPLAAAPSDRERLRALARELRTDADWATDLGAMMGWERKLRRAAVATRHPTQLRDPELLAELAAGERFSVTELERYGDCSSMWFVDRVLSPREIDFELDARMRGSIAHATLARFFTLLPAELGLERLSEDDLPDAYPLMRRCLARGARRSARARLGGRQGARPRARARPGRVPARRGRPGASARPAPVRGALRRADGGAWPEGRACASATSRSPARSTASTWIPSMSPRGLVWDYKSGASAHSAGEMEREGRLQIPLYILALRDLLGVEPLGGMYRALAGKRAARGLVLAGEIDARGHRRAATSSTPTTFWAQVGRATEVARGRGRRHARRPRPPRPAHGRVPGLVHAAHDLPGAAAVSADRWNPEQRAAVERRGHVFVAAGAGTGKTAVLVERVLAQVLGGTPIDRLLAITFTDRAASELRRRVREGLELAGEMERARAIDTAWISTIHRFCLRILRANAFEAGLDPRFAVADEVGARLLRSRGVRHRARAVPGRGAGR